MPDYTVKRFDEMEPLLGGFFLRARAALGASSFGMQILQMPPGAGDMYPNHDHADEGMEEVYVGAERRGGLRDRGRARARARRSGDPLPTPERRRATRPAAGPWGRTYVR